MTGEARSDGPGAFADLPLVVLVDGNSASASELVALSLASQQRATIVGDPTFGKGVQQLKIDHADGGTTTVTNARILAPERSVGPGGVPVSVTTRQLRQLSRKYGYQNGDHVLQGAWLLLQEQISTRR